MLDQQDNKVAEHPIDALVSPCRSASAAGCPSIFPDRIVDAPVQLVAPPSRMTLEPVMNALSSVAR